MPKEKLSKDAGDSPVCVEIGSSKERVTRRRKTVPTRSAYFLQ